MRETYQVSGDCPYKFYKDGNVSLICGHEEFPMMYRWRIPGECLLISSLPGKALRTLVDIASLADRFNMRSQSRA